MEAGAQLGDRSGLSTQSRGQRLWLGFWVVEEQGEAVRFTLWLEGEVIFMLWKRLFEVCVCLWIGQLFCCWHKMPDGHLGETFTWLTV